MVHFLEPGHALVESRLDVGAGPAYGPLLLAFGLLAETVVFKGESDQRYVDSVVVLEIIALV